MRSVLDLELSSFDRELVMVLCLATSAIQLYSGESCFKIVTRPIHLWRKPAFRQELTQPRNQSEACLNLIQVPLERTADA